MTHPVHVRESPAARRWLAARSLWWPLVLLKVGSPILTIATLAVILREEDLAARPLGVLFALAVPFALPFGLAAAYPWVRWMPQQWTIDADGIRGRGRAAGHWRWAEVQGWTMTPTDRLADHVHVVFRRRGAFLRRSVHMVVSMAEREAVEAWFRGAPCEHSRTRVTSAVGSPRKENGR